MAAYSLIQKYPMRINEIFLSIQGESTYQGRLCLFIRTTGCNLRCTYCDTEYAFNEGEEMDSDDLFTIVENSGVRLVEITGGEPLLQKGISGFVKRLLDADYEVLVETSGSLDIDKIDRRAVRVMDLKCPSSGEKSKNNWLNIDKLTERDEVKFVIGDREDYDWALQIIEKTGLEKKAAVLMAPVFGELDAKELAGWMLKDKKNFRLQLQLHKYIWGPNTRGV